MLDASNIEKDFKRKVCEQLEVVAEGINRYLIITPMAFDDGDALPIVLKKEDERWILSDEGHTFMQLSYEFDDLDLTAGGRGDLITKALNAFNVSNRNGELILPITDERYGDHLYGFVQTLLKVDDVRYLSRERVRSTFYEDFLEVMSELVPAERRTFKWHDERRDPDAKYEVDCRVNGAKVPLFIFALPNDDRVNIATISLLNFEKWGMPYQSLGIFEEQEKINPKTLARFGDVCGKTFSNLPAVKERFRRFYLEYSGSEGVG